MVAVRRPEPFDGAGQILDQRRLAQRADEHHHGGERVILTNGCFDVLHRGHVRCLQQARDLGDVLIVAINSDAGVRRLKGPGRPVNPVADRAAILAALRCVDYVTVFDEPTPLRLIERIRPDCYAKGGDYTAFTLPESAAVARYGGEVVILDYLAGRSTTATVERLRRSGERISAGEAVSLAEPGGGLARLTH